MLPIARKDLLQIARDRKTLLFLILMPVVFTLFFAMAFGGLSGPASTAPPTVHIENRDADDPLSRAFVEQLRSSNALTVLPGADPEGGAAATLTLPSGFGGALSGGGDAAYELSVRADPAAESRVRGAVDAALSRVASAVATGTIVAGAERELRAPAIEGALQAWRTPPVRVQGSEAAAGAAAAASPATLSPFAQASAGMIVQFAVYGLILSATLLVLERRSGTLQRLAATRLSRASVLGGHLLAMFTVVLAQTLLLLAFGQLALGVPYARAPLAVLVVATALAAWSAALGFLLGCLARTEEQVVMGALVAMFVFSALGGAWFPLEVTGGTFSAVGHAMPTAWAMDGFNDILVRGHGAGAVLAPAGILMAYAVSFFALGWWRFDPRP